MKGKDYWCRDNSAYKVHLNDYQPVAIKNLKSISNKERNQFIRLHLAVAILRELQYGEMRWILNTSEQFSIEKIKDGPYEKLKVGRVVDGVSIIHTYHIANNEYSINHAGEFLRKKNIMLLANILKRILRDKLDAKSISGNHKQI